MPEIIFLWLGLLCLGYFVGIARYVGWTSKFPIVWAGLGAGLLLTGILILTENLSKKAELLCYWNPASGFRGGGSGCDCFCYVSAC